MLAVLLLAPLATAFAASYETRMVDGREFRIGKEGALEVWFSLATVSEEIGAYFLVVNNGAEAVEVFPERVRAEAVISSEKGTKQTRMKTYYPQQIERILEKRNWHVGGLKADPPAHMGGGPRGNPAGGYASGPQPIANSECAAGNQSACSYLVHNGSLIVNTPLLNPLDSTAILGSLSDMTLLRSRKVPAHESYGGVVYMKYQRGDYYHISLPLAGTSFDFDFGQQEAAGLKTD